LRASLNQSVRLDLSWAADPNEWREMQILLGGLLDQALEHLDQAVNRGIAIKLFVGAAPELEFRDLGFRRISCTLLIELNDAGSNIGAADVHGQDGIMGLKYPGRRQVHGPE
jgi:hypothetical protein